MFQTRIVSVLPVSVRSALAQIFSDVPSETPQTL
jgi:hypothetical protein